MDSPQRISYVPFEEMTPEMQAEMERCAREARRGPRARPSARTCPPRSGSCANSWKDLFREGIVDHRLKELCRVYVSRSVKCEYCGNQRSEKGREGGLVEGKYDELLNFESSDTYSAREKAALAYAEAIVWTGNADDALWERLYEHFNEGELVELGCMIGLTLGQQSYGCSTSGTTRSCRARTPRWRPATTWQAPEARRADLRRRSGSASTPGRRTRASRTIATAGCAARSSATTGYRTSTTSIRSTPIRGFPVRGPDAAVRDGGAHNRVRCGCSSWE